ncbi:MAG: hypothetical protein KDA63_15710, partial [Planctomycetales bacterium]|nr:hypothetical protein [Planctomycetales bacterium]
HATIAATIDQMQAKEKDFDVLQLDRVDTFSANDAIEALFRDEPVRPSVDADYGNQRIVVRGTPEQLEEIRDLLFKMGETTLAQGHRGRSRTMRVISVDGDVRRALDEVQRIWPQLRGNPVRVVKPSAVFPTLRPHRASSDDETPPEHSKPSDEKPPAGDDDQSNTAPRDDTAPIDRHAVGTQMPSGNSVAHPAEHVTRGVTVVPSARFLVPSLALAYSLVDGSDAADVASPADAAMEEETVDAESDSAVDITAIPADDDQTAPIIVSPGVDGVTIASDDLEALDEFERLLRSILQSESLREPEFTVIQLKHAEASLLAETLQQAFGQASGRSRFRSRSFGGRSGLTEPSFVAYERLNAVLVRAEPDDLEAIERLIDVLDTSELPDTLLVPQPELIRLEHAKAFRVERVLRDVYREQLSANGGRRRRVPTGFTSALRELRGAGLNSELTMTAIQQLTSQDQGPELTMGVDEQTNSLVVMASTPLLDEIREVVASLDKSAEEAYQTVKVLPLESTNTQAVERALKTLTQPRRIRNR